MQHPEDNKKLLQQLEALLLKQEQLQQEVEKLRLQVLSATSAASDLQLPGRAPAPQQSPVTRGEHGEKLPPAQPIYSSKAAHAPADTSTLDQGAPSGAAPKAKSDLEKFIGENLINKIGIIIIIFGVAVGAKYAIDNELISPLTRIIMGYGAGLALISFAIYLKKNYPNFSAVLLSGSMAILYFITLAAFSFYGLFPQALTFGLMLLFTAFTVVAALHYNMQVIAHIGLVGAYAVPFLLSDGSGRVHILFSYMAIINTGILIIAYKRYWKPLYYLAFGISWLIFLAWFSLDYRVEKHFAIGLGFAALFFSIFYLTFLLYKLTRKEIYGQADVVLLLFNSFIFFGVGYAILDGHPVADQYLGLFTLLNALVHFMVCAIVYRRALADRNLFYLLAGLVLVFITIAVPVQLEGNWVTLLWTGEAALLFWIGRGRGVKIYERLSYPLILLAFASLLHDWSLYYPMGYATGIADGYTPLLNPYFLTSLLFVAAFAFMAWFDYKTIGTTADRSLMQRMFSYTLGLLLLIGAYYAFELEIAAYWTQLYEASHISIPETETEPPIWLYNISLLQFKDVWVLNYSILFVCGLAFFNILKLRNRELGWLTLALAGLVVIGFLTQGLNALSTLRLQWQDASAAEYYSQGLGNLLVRYLCFSLLALLLWACYKLKKQDFLQLNIKIAYDFLLYGSILWLASNELVHWISLGGYSNAHELGLSILWGIYSLIIIGIGIGKKKKHLRIGAFLLFGITLLKLFFYDIAHLDTIAKTIVLVSLGILLLIISFLYNKYKHLIADASHE
ncbi:DUF2339 domain-containing protein [Cesiribacter sp. SM1]|uniref:DUF2339 domain-containing protein n=1 Tax=Cesiribacter sp. SM1 TaxID=2861196 RepID=UPI001CD4E9BE|nr:DUF2339 domain-containing protein [Cesiribacter sp. SM1]